MFAVLGDLEFEVNTLTGMEATEGVDYAEHALIAKKPRLQFVGEKLTELKVSLTFHVSICNPEASLQILQQVMQTHEARAFVTGAGDYRGTFVITELKTVAQHADILGGLMFATVDLLLREFAGDASKNQPPALGTAGSANMQRLIQARTAKPVSETFDIPQTQSVDTQTVQTQDTYLTSTTPAPTSPAAVAVAQTKSAVSQTQKVLDTVSTIHDIATTHPDQALRRLPGILNQAAAVLPSFGVAESSLQSLQSAAAIATEVQQATIAVQQMQHQVGTMVQIGKDTNLSGLTEKLSSLSGVSDQVHISINLLNQPLAVIAKAAILRAI